MNRKSGIARDAVPLPADPEPERLRFLLLERGPRGSRIARGYTCKFVRGAGGFQAAMNWAADVPIFGSRNVRVFMDPCGREVTLQLAPDARYGFRFQFADTLCPRCDGHERLSMGKTQHMLRCVRCGSERPVDFGAAER